MKRIKGTIGGMTVDLSVEDVEEIVVAKDGQSSFIPQPPPLNKDAWRDDPATQSQQWKLNTIGLWSDGMTKGEAHKIIRNYEEMSHAKVEFNNDTNTATVTPSPQLYRNGAGEALPWEEIPKMKKRGRPRKT